MKVCLPGLAEFCVNGLSINMPEGKNPILFGLSVHVENAYILRFPLNNALYACMVASAAIPSIHTR